MSSDAIDTAEPGWMRWQGRVLLLWALCAMFLLRVLAQAVQRWWPREFLPPFTDFQGSHLRYPVLLGAQVIILGLMLRACRFEQRGGRPRSALSIRMLRWFGVVYLGGSLLRLLVGLTAPDAPAWFRAWIPGVFHLVLAAFVLVLSVIPRRVGLASRNRARNSAWLDSFWYPAFMTAAIAGYGALLRFGAPTLLAAYGPVLLVVLLLLLLERSFPARAAWWPTRADVVTDARFLLFVQLLAPRCLALLAVILLSAGGGGADGREAMAWSSPWPHVWPLWMQIALMIVLVDFGRYWLHRACHRFQPLWRLHAVHHSPDILYVLNVGRFHPSEKLLHFAVDTLPFLVLGVEPQVIAGYYLVYSVNGLFQHSNLRLRLGWFNYLVGSAETHRWHHARDPHLAACNFGSTLNLWDLLFGTWYLPARRQVGELGLPQREYPRNFLGLLRAPFRGLRRPQQVAADMLANLCLRFCLGMVRMTWWLRMRRQLADPMRLQRQLLSRILRANRRTAFGSVHDFARLKGPGDYAERVPVSTYEQLRPLVDAQIGSGQAALTAEAPISYLRTSGTTGRPKDLPLTVSYLASLRRIQRLAVAFQHRNCPAAFAGSMLTITGAAREGVLENGSAYGSASGLIASGTPWLMRRKFIVPACVSDIHDPDLKYLTILRLAMARRDLTYAATANPGTLLVLIRLFRQHRGWLLEDLRRGGFRRAAELPESARRELPARFTADPERAEELVARSTSGEELRLADLWPRLQLVGTWTFGSSGVALAALRRELPPGTRVLDIGYIASEFHGTVTLGRRSGSGLPTFDTHFLEFIEREQWETGSPEVLGLAQLRKGQDYHVIVTTPCGLYRYFMNDLVRVTGRLHGTPLLRFVQKGKGVTSLTGEKLYESQLLAAMRSVFTRWSITARFAMMLADEQTGRYRLFVECWRRPGPAADLAQAIDRRLGDLNLEYRAKRASGRLGALELCWLRIDTAEAYKRHCVARGQREAQFKTVALAYGREVDFDLDAHCLPE